MCRYHWPGVPSASVTRVQAGPPKTDFQLFGGSFAGRARAVAEEVARSLDGAGRGCQSGLEPDVRVGGVVRDEVDDDPHAELVRALLHPVEVGERSEQRVDVAVVGHVVAGVLLRRGEERGEPDGVDAELGEVVEACRDAGQVAHAVAVGVRERTGVDLVDHGRAPPLGARGDAAAHCRAHSCVLRRGMPPMVVRTYFLPVSGAERRRADSSDRSPCKKLVWSCKRLQQPCVKFSQRIVAFPRPPDL